MSKPPGITDNLRPIMPSLVRLLAGVIVLFVIQVVALGLPGISQNLPSTSITMDAFLAFAIGLVAAIVVLKFGMQLSDAVADAYRNYKPYVPLLTYFFQIAAVYILYNACRVVSSEAFTSAPWAYPLIFLVLAVVPTVRVLTSLVHAFEGQESQKHVLKQFA